MIFILEDVKFQWIIADRIPGLTTSIPAINDTLLKEGNQVKFSGITDYIQIYKRIYDIVRIQNFYCSWFN